MNAPFRFRYVAIDDEQMTLHTSLDGLVSWTATAIVGRANAEAALTAFRSANWTNPQAEASIWSAREVRYIEKWRGGVAFGPVDTRHPLERIYRRAVQSGRSVLVGDDSGMIRVGGAK